VKTQSLQQGLLVTNNPFSRPLLRSRSFLVVILALSVLILFSAFVFCNFWSRMSSSTATGLFILLYLGVGGQWIRAFRRYRQIYELYLTGAISEVSVGSPMEIVLNVAEKSMVDGLLFGTLAMLAFLTVLVHFLQAGGATFTGG
jgi:hypothetical protein